MLMVAANNHRYDRQRCALPPVPPNPHTCCLPAWCLASAGLPSPGAHAPPSHPRQGWGALPAGHVASRGTGESCRALAEASGF